MAQRFSNMTQGFTDEDPSRLDPQSREGYRAMAGSMTQIGSDIRRENYERGKMERMANKAYRAAAKGNDPSAYIQAYEFMSKVKSGGGSLGGGIRQSGNESMRSGQLELERRSALTGNSEIIPGKQSVYVGGEYNGQENELGNGMITKGTGSSNLSNGVRSNRLDPELDARQQKDWESGAPGRAIAEAGSILENYASGLIDRAGALSDSAGILFGKKTDEEGYTPGLRSALDKIDQRKYNQTGANSLLGDYASGKSTSKEDIVKQGKKFGGSEESILKALEEIDKKKKRGEVDFNF